MTTIALVTGANKGIGKQTARLLCAAGYTVYLGARDAELGRRAADDLSTGQPGAEVRYVALDVTDDGSVSAAADRIGTEAGRLDLLVNNAGISLERGRPASALTAGELRDTFEVNVFGAVRVTHAMLPLLRRSGQARVVNVSSELGSVRLLADPGRPEMFPDLLAYCSSKAALNAVTVMYANELRAAGITVNAVSPGFCATDLNGNRGHLTATQGAEVVVQAATGAPPATGTFLTSEGVTPW
jgi:NAD(P)-dependent dehydrogenase (short-subunit alcohol dehydrogenase family)